MSRSRLLFFVASTAFCIALFAKAAITLDPDFGYRMRTGQLIVHQGIPGHDPYSYTMPSFPYVEHALLIAVAWGALYPAVGYAGIAAVHVAVVAAVAFLVWRMSGNYENSRQSSGAGVLSAVLLLSGIGALFTFFGNRAQTTSWLLFAVLYSAFSNTKIWLRYRVFVPLFFLLWAHTHGSFPAGLAVTATMIAARWVRAKTLDRIDVLVLLASIIATFATPYREALWRESLSSITDPNLRTYIYEWMPPFLSMTLAVGFYTALALFFIVRYRKRFLLEIKAVFFLILASALSSTRNVPLFIIYTIPLALASVRLFVQDIQKVPFAHGRLLMLSRMLFIFTVGIVSIQIHLDLKNAQELSESSAYPKGAVSYLQGNLPTGQVFSQFYWGGYLVWHLPEKKVYIDGRMASWRHPDAPEGETSAVFLDYIGLLSGEKDYRGEFEHYGIDTVLWSLPAESTPQAPSFLTAIVQSLAGKRDEPKGLIHALQEDGWTAIYQDDVATIYKSPVATYKE